MKRITSFIGGIVAGLLSTILFFSCSKDKNDTPITSNIAAPKIENIELGHDNTKTAEIGNDLHFEATITAEATIKEIKLLITYSQGSSSFKVEENFTKSIGLKGYNIHQHFDIPTDAAEGNYNFLLKVTDTSGQTVELKDVVKVTKAIDLTEDNSLPLSTLQLGVLNQCIAMPRADFIAKLGSIAHEWTDEDEIELVYYATKKESPFELYKVTVTFENVADLSTPLPYKPYDGVAKITVVPVNTQKEVAVNTDASNVLHYFEHYINSFQQKPLKYIRKNTDIGYEYNQFTQEEFYTSLPNKNIEADAIILWNKNPKALAKDSSKEKNTPIVELSHFYETHTYQLSLEFNAPKDFSYNIKF
ncbi:hypothetical protein RCZ04_20300 [Capnocytophaga sp. HP1101]